MQYIKYQYDMDKSGEFLIDQFNYDDFQIKSVFTNSREDLYFVYIPTPQSMSTPYLHKDGTVWGSCGTENFFESEEAARKIIDIAFRKPEMLTDEDFRIDI